MVPLVTGQFADKPTHGQSTCRLVNSLKGLIENLQMMKKMLCRCLHYYKPIPT